MILPKDDQLFNFSTSHNISCSQIKPMKTLPYAYRGTLPSKLTSEIIFDLGNVFSLQKYVKTPTAADGAVMM